MIIVMEKGAPLDQIERIIEEVQALGYIPHPIIGTDRTVVAAVGDERGKERIFQLDSLPGVEKVLRILQPYKLASAETHPERTIVDVGGVKVGGKDLAIMAGPCAVENEKQIMESAEIAKVCGAQFLRGGAFKPRTSPYSFQGLGEEGLKLLAKAKRKTGLKIVTEIMEIQQLPLMEKYVDVIQIGTRNMSNFSLLQVVGKSKKPILLKRGMMATIKEFLMAAEYIMSQGNYNVILCERGIRTFETETRNTLDLNAVAVIKRQSHLPIIVDPSHATGRRDIVESMSMASIAAGADGLILEMHPHPGEAVSDGAQSLYPEDLKRLVNKLKKLAPVIGKSVSKETITPPKAKPKKPKRAAKKSKKS